MHATTDAKIAWLSTHQRDDQREYQRDNRRDARQKCNSFENYPVWIITNACTRFRVDVFWFLVGVFWFRVGMFLISRLCVLIRRWCVFDFALVCFWFYVGVFWFRVDMFLISHWCVLISRWCVFDYALVCFDFALVCFDFALVCFDFALVCFAHKKAVLRFHLRCHTGVLYKMMAIATLIHTTIKWRKMKQNIWVLAGLGYYPSRHETLNESCFNIFWRLKSIPALKDLKYLWWS